MNSTTYQVSGMTCGHCESSVREELGEVRGVESIEVSASTGRLVVTGSDEIDESSVLDAVAEAGYSAVRVP